jgi:hypothetical protein
MESKKVGEIKAAIRDQAMIGRRSVRIDVGRVIDARVKRGQLQAKTMSGEWRNVDSVTINYRW